MISSNGKENDQQLPELEVDELEDVPPIPEEEISKSLEGKYREKKGLLLCIAIGLCLFIGIGYLYLKSNQKEEVPQVDRLSIPKDQLLICDSFVIPLEDNKKFTYISLSISFNVPNKELKREMMEKKDQLRGIIYDILREEIHKAKEIPSLKKLKEFIIRGVNIALSTGKVNEVYITKFLAV